MSENDHDLMPAGGGAALPRFLLNRSQSDDAGIAARDAADTWTAGRTSATAAAGMLALMSSAFLTPDASLQRANLAPAPVQVETVRVTPAPVLPQTGHLEERLAFAERFGAHLITMARLQDMESVGVTPLSPQLPIGDADPPVLPESEPETASLLIVRNLPEGATFSEGVAAGTGAWAIGGQDPDVIVAAIDGGIDEAITAQVDFIAPSGAMLETRAVDLPAKPKAASVSKPQPWQAAKARVAKVEPGPKRRAAAFKRKKAVQIAGETVQKSKRRKRRVDDAYRAQAQKQNAIENGQAGVQDEAGEEGALSKFFSFFKGGSSAKSEPPATKETARDYDGSLRGLGMFPQD